MLRPRADIVTHGQVEGSTISLVQHACGMMNASCNFDGMEKTLQKLRGAERLRKAVTQWAKSGVPPAKFQEAPWLLSRAPTCEAEPVHAAHGRTELQPITEGKYKGVALQRGECFRLFGTRVLRVRSGLKPAVLAKVAATAEKRYSGFAKGVEKKGRSLDPNDVNDAFFGAQPTRDGDFERHKYTEYNSAAYEAIRKGIRKTVDQYLQMLELPQPGAPEGFVYWMAIYPGKAVGALREGGRHGYHAHQDSIVSCVFYVATDALTTPITFLDPRAKNSVDNFERYDKEWDFQPRWPFHESLYIFPDAGDIVCFPSWLIHNVPAHHSASTTRVVMAANLQSRQWDAWARTVES